MAENINEPDITTVTEALASDQNLALFFQVSPAIQQDIDFTAWSAANVLDHQLDRVLDYLEHEFHDCSAAYDKTIGVAGDLRLRCGALGVNVGSIAARVPGREREQMIEIADQIRKMRNAIGSIGDLIALEEERRSS